MIKYFLSVLFALVFLILFPFTLKAQVFTAGSSGVPKFKVEPESKFDYRAYTLRKFLAKQGSPLTPYSQDFIAMADYYRLDYRMVPAISGVESTFGKRIPTKSYNAYGWNGGRYVFKSWPDSIQIVSRSLRNNYVNKGAVSIQKIGRIYAPPSATWGSKVKYFVGKISILPLSFDI
jgi:hypothetical protein